MNVAPIPALGSIDASGRLEERGAQTFAGSFAAALDDAGQALDAADALAVAIAAGKDSIVEASVARAKADVLLEIVSVTASRVSGALNALFQTQV